MCFSASASFAASGGLLAIGAASYRVASQQQKMIAVVPALFGIQQAFEGVQWLAHGAGTVHMPAAYGFLFFAFLVWPVFLPSAVFMLDEKRKNILRWFMGAGIGMSLWLLGVLSTRPLTVRVWQNSIWYDISTPFDIAGVIIYVSIVCGAFIVSSKPALRWLGMVSLLSAGISTLFFYTAFTSVWCFFAALISSMIFFFLKSQKEAYGH